MTRGNLPLCVVQYPVKGTHPMLLCFFVSLYNILPSGDFRGRSNRKYYSREYESN